MALNPYTLNHLYQQGILDYVPTDLMMGTPVGISTPMTNPYLDLAQSGQLYQNHGTTTDSFHSSYTPAYTPAYPHNVSNASNYGAYADNSVRNGIVQIGSQSNAGGMNAFRGYGIGTYNNNGTLSAFGYDGIVGSNSNAGGTNMFNGVGIGTYSNAGGANAFGGFADTQNHLANGFNKTSSVTNRTPKVLLGIISGIIGITAIAFALKGGKKPSNTNGNKSFWSKLNPLNWFSKKK